MTNAVVSLLAITSGISTGIYLQSFDAGFAVFNGLLALIIIVNETGKKIK
jgi:hypothetical protein